MPHNTTRSGHRTWLGDFNFIRHMSIPYRNGQYLNLPMGYMQGIWIQEMLSADILRPLSVISYDFFYSSIIQHQASFIK